MSFPKIYIIPLVLLFGHLIPIVKKYVFDLNKFLTDCNKSNLKTIFKLSTVPIMTIVSSYFITNFGRLVLSFYDKSFDLSLLLVYVKSSLIVTVVMQPFSNFLKPFIFRKVQK